MKLGASSLMRKDILVLLSLNIVPFYHTPLLCVLSCFWSSRAQARAALGREFPRPLFRSVEWGPRSAITHVSCAPSKIPDGEFSPVRLQAVASSDHSHPSS